MALKLAGRASSSLRQYCSATGVSNHCLSTGNAIGHVADELHSLLWSDSLPPRYPESTSSEASASVFLHLGDAGEQEWRGFCTYLLRRETILYHLHVNRLILLVKSKAMVNGCALQHQVLVFYLEESRTKQAEVWECAGHSLPLKTARSL